MSGHIHIEAFEGRLGSSFRVRTLTVLLLKITRTLEYSHFKLKIKFVCVAIHSLVMCPCSHDFLVMSLCNIIMVTNLCIVPGFYMVYQLVINGCIKANINTK